MTESDHTNASMGWTTLVIGTVVALVLYVGFPVFLLYPVMKVFDNHPPGYVDAPLRIIFMPVIAAANHSRTYNHWIEWQCNVTGVR